MRHLLCLMLGFHFQQLGQEDVSLVKEWQEALGECFLMGGVTQCPMGLGTQQ